MTISSNSYTYERAAYIMRQIKDTIENRWDKPLDEWKAGTWDMIHHKPRESTSDTYYNTWGVAFRPPESRKHKLTLPVIRVLRDSRYGGSGVEWSPKHECFFVCAHRSGETKNAAPEGFPIRYYDNPESEKVPEKGEYSKTVPRMCDRCDERTEHGHMNSSRCGVERGFIKTMSTYACLECGLRHNTKCS